MTRRTHRLIFDDVAAGRARCSCDVTGSREHVAAHLLEVEGDRQGRRTPMTLPPRVKPRASRRRGNGDPFSRTSQEVMRFKR